MRNLRRAILLTAARGANLNTPATSGRDVRGPYSDYAAPPIYIYPETKRPGLRFSRTEIVQLSVAILALSGAFTLLYARSFLFGGLSGYLATLLGLFFASSLLAVGTGVGLHEIAHKAVAQRYGHWAEFRYYPMGLVLAFVFAIFGFIYGAPGATYIQGAVTRTQNGRISGAGPGTNVVMATVFGALAILVNFGPVSTNLAAFSAAFVVQNAALVNLILGGFNMIPLMPLDGAKVWQWNKAAYLGLIALVAVLFIALWLAGAFSLIF